MTTKLRLFVAVVALALSTGACKKMAGIDPSPQPGSPTATITAIVPDKPIGTTTLEVGQSMHVTTEFSVTGGSPSEKVTVYILFILDPPTTTTGGGTRCRSVASIGNSMSGHVDVTSGYAKVTAITVLIMKGCFPWDNRGPIPRMGDPNVISVETRSS